MCSTGEERLARLGRAIEELAADAQAQPRNPADEDVTSRLAGIWAMLAELEPELASRVRGYQAAPRAPSGPPGAAPG